MMPRFYFHLMSKESRIPDDRGKEFVADVVQYLVDELSSVVMCVIQSISVF
jgi:hypothetical protein